jgi:predicted nucleotidyltransferase
MMPGNVIDTAVPLPLTDIAAVCERYQVERLDVFGSVLRDDFRADSDVDFLVVFRDDNRGAWLSKLQAFEEELARLLGRPVDVVDRRGIEKSDNWIRRRDILSSARMIYGS